MKIVAIVSQKGGTGKTTTAINLSAGMAELGNNVLTLDANEQGDLSDTLAAEPGTGGMADLLSGEDVTRLIRKTNIPKVDTVTGDERLANIERIVQVVGAARGTILKDALKPVRKKYQFVVIDAPGSFNITMLNALCAADSVIITAQPDYYSLKGINRLIKNIRFVQRELNHKLVVDGILLTRYQGRRNVSKEVVATLEEAQAALGTRLFKAKIRENTKVAEAPREHKTVLEYAPGSIGAEDYREFINEYMGMIKEEQ